MDLLLNILACWFITDFISGIFHWYEDVYLVPGRNVKLNEWIILPNLAHHKHPGGIRQGSYLSTNIILIVIALTAAGVGFLFHVGWTYYLVCLFGSHVNQVHVWAHTSRPPRLVKYLQNLGVFQTVLHHGLHHRRPYGVNYCILTNYLNPILDKLGFWRILEKLIGIEPKNGTVARSSY